MGDNIEETSERTLRSSLIEELLNHVPQYSVRDTFSLHHYNIEPDLNNLLESLYYPQESALNVRPVLDDSGEIVRFENYLLDPENIASASCSMSLNRLPDASAANSVRGSASNIPFFPGGFEKDLTSVLNSDMLSSENDKEELQYLEPTELLSIPPKWDYGMACSKEEPINDVLSMSAGSEMEDLDIFELMDIVGGVSSTTLKEVVDTLHKREPDLEKKMEKTILDDDPENSSEIDEVLATKLQLALENMSAAKPKHNFINVLDTQNDVPAYRELEQRMAKKFPFKLDPFQQASVCAMEDGNSLFVAAHTSAGKTVVAEYAIALCKAHKTRVIYTSPIKALSNQKYRDFKLTFNDVGLVTGDIQISTDAFCLIMTTEILRSMLYNGSEIIRDLEWVIFDEVHYINNDERGHVWEEVLIMLPSHVKIVMLSATVPNFEEFADWVGRIKNRKITVVSTMKRPVPLEHWIYVESHGKIKGSTDVYKLIDSNGCWNNAAYKAALAAKDSAKHSDNNKGQMAIRGQGYNPGQQHNQGNGQYQNYQNSQNRGGGGGGGYRGRGGHDNYNNRSGGHIKARTNDKGFYIHLIHFLKNKELLPMVFFVFSRKRCDTNAQLASSLDLTTSVEKGHIKSFFSECVMRLKGSDKKLPQVLVMRELCIRGFAVHHSGILPILKEVVELLFQKGYIKVLFATETFAMGVNMPARCVVFDTVEKHDGTVKRPLNPGEYIQMAGRAGRRGLDSTGTVILLAKDTNLHDSGYYQSIMMGKALPLESKFRVTYSMLLNLLRVEHIHVEQMLQRSYVERTSLREEESKKQLLIKTQKELDTLGALNCSLCADNLTDYLSNMVEYFEARSNIWREFYKTKNGAGAFSSGRIVIVSNYEQNLDHAVAVLLEETGKSDSKKFSVMVSCNEEYAYNFSKLSSENPEWSQNCHRMRGVCKYGLDGIGRQSDLGTGVFKIVENISFLDFVVVTKKQLKFDLPEVLAEGERRKQARFRSNEIPFSIMKILQKINSLANEYASDQVKSFEPETEIGIVNMEMFELPSIVKTLRQSLMNPSSYPARHCPELLEHAEKASESWALKRKIHALEFDLSTGSLLLSEEYRDHMKMLTTLGYVGKDNIVSFKGRVACEIHHREILIAELLLENKLHDRSPAEVAALLSAFTCQYKQGDGIKFDLETDEGKVFYQLKMDVVDLSDRINKLASDLKLKIMEVGDEVRFDLLPVVYDWAMGEPFAQIMMKTECQEGLIVRCIQRLSELCKDVRNASRIIGDQALYEKMEMVSSAIKRDIVFAASLYTTV